MRGGDHHDNRASNIALVDALAGVLASLTTVWAFYPIDLYKTRLQASTDRKQENSQRDTTLRKHLSSFDIICKQYEGLGLKTLHSATSSFSYFYLYSWIASRYTQDRQRRSSSKSISPQVRLLLTAIAAMGNTLLTLPLDVVATRRQARSDGTLQICDEEETSNDNVSDHSDNDMDDKQSLHAHHKVLIRLRDRLRSIFHFWRGLWPSLLLCSNPAINYTVFDAVKARYMVRHGRTQLGMIEAFVLGLVSKFLSTIATYPLIAAKSKLMANNGATSLLQCLKKDFGEGGIVALYRGCNVQLFHTVLKSALMMMLKEKITTIAHNLVHG